MVTHSQDGYPGKVGLQLISGMSSLLILIQDMQSVAGIPVEIIRIIQGLIIVFVAAPEIIRSLYRLKEVKKTGPVVAQSTEEI